MAEDLFSDDNTTSENTLREELLNKWKDKPAEELLKAKVESDLYIKTLESRADELRNEHAKILEDAKARANLQELIDQMRSTQNKDTSSDNTNNANVNNPPEIKLPDIDKIIQDKLREAQQNRIEEENYKQVINKLKDKFGNDYQRVLSEQTSKLGLDKTFVNDLARKHPEVLFRTLGMDEQPRDIFQAPMRNEQRPGSFAPQTTKRTRSYYLKMKQENPKLYLDKKTTIQMHKDAESMGEAFFDVDE